MDILKIGEWVMVHGIIKAFVRAVVISNGVIRYNISHVNNGGLVKAVINEREVTSTITKVNQTSGLVENMRIISIGQRVTANSVATGIIIHATIRGTSNITYSIQVNTENGPKVIMAYSWELTKIPESVKYTIVNLNKVSDCIPTE